MDKKTLNKRIAMDYWRNKSSHPTLDMSTSSLKFDYSGDRELNIETTEKLDPDTLTLINSLFGESQASIYCFFLTVFYIVISKYQKNQTAFISTYPLRFKENDLQSSTKFFFSNSINENQDFWFFYKEVKEELIKLYKYQNLSSTEFDAVVSPEFRHSEVHFVSNGISNCDLIEIDADILVIVDSKDEGYDLTIRYKYDQYNQFVLEGILVNYIKALRLFVENLSQPISNFSLLLSERTNFQATFDNNSIPDASCLTKHFQFNVKLNPNSIAVIEDDHQITFACLEAKVEKLSNYLCVKCTIMNNPVVAIISEPSIVYVTALLASIRALRVTVPIDPKLPRGRIEYIIKDCNASLLLLDAKYIDLADELQWDIPHLTSYLCLSEINDNHDEDIIHDNAVNSLMNSYMGQEDVDEISQAGWISSYTGEKFSDIEISELVSNVRIKVCDSLNKEARVLEIGCGSGLILFELAPLVKEYHGIDISDLIINQLSDQVKRQNLNNVKLFKLSALEIDSLSLNGENYDLVIINSAMTHFPSYRYLRSFLTKAVSLIREGGHFFIGDVRDKTKQLDFYSSLITFSEEKGEDFFLTQNAYDNTDPNINYYKGLYGHVESAEKAILEAKKNETHFFIDPQFFKDFFHYYFPGSEVVVSDKIGTVKNELIRFRFDVNITIKKSTVKTNLFRLAKRQLFNHQLEEVERVENDLKGEGSIVLYTSGSSGDAKGVVIQEPNLLSLVKNEANLFNTAGRMSWAFIHSVSFDVSLWELFGCLLNGGKLIIFNFGNSFDPAKTVMLLAKHGIDVLTNVPTMFKMLEPELTLLASNLQLKYLVLGGEKLDRSIIQKFKVNFPSLQVINAYGLTECSVISTWNWMDSTSVQMSIGWPISDTSIFILDDNRNFQPQGVFGEMYISGRGVTLGYLNDPEKTNVSFLEFADGSGTFYKTGDIARWLPSGELEFRGRKDQQLKIQGYRVEIAEIERALLSHPKITDAVVVSDENRSDIFLTCYYILGEQFLDNSRHIFFRSAGVNTSKEMLKVADIPPGNIVNFNDDDSFFRRFCTQATISPHRVAFQCDDQMLTYRQLLNRVAVLANYIKQNCDPRPGSLIAIIIDRSIEFFQYVLATWKLGCAYIAIDPAYPEQRIVDILDDANVDIIISRKIYQERFVDKLSQTDARMLAVEDIRYTKSIDSDPVEANQSDLAYVMFTSGSSGKPKGVMIEQIGMLNHMEAKIAELGFHENSIIAQNASHCFDISIWQAFTSLLVGGRTVFYLDDHVSDVAQFILDVTKHTVSVLEIVPTYLAEIIDVLEQKPHPKSIFTALKTLISNAETLKPQLVSRWFAFFSDKIFINTYGATEASDDTSHYLINKDEQIDTIPICSKPIQNFTYHLLNEGRAVKTSGEVGEIFLSSQFIARGYLNDVERTNEFFIKDYLLENGQLMYKTGDLGRLSKSGKLLFVGRADNQIKINGNRVEPNEVEHALIAIEGVKDAVVIGSNNSSTSTLLIALVVLSSRAKVDEFEIKEILMDRLPPYMVPSRIDILPSFPLSTNGKVDRNLLKLQYGEIVHNNVFDKELRRYLLQTLPPHMIPNSFIAVKAMPFTINGKVDKKELSRLNKKRDSSQDLKIESSTSKILLLLWQDVLGIQDIAVDDNFFERGGHSLKGAKLISLIEKSFAVKVELSFIFLYPTIGKQAEEIIKQKRNTFEHIPCIEEQEFYPVSHAQMRLLLASLQSTQPASYNMLSAFEIAEAIDRDVLSESFKVLINRHEILKTSFLIYKEEFRQKVNEIDSLGEMLQYYDWSDESKTVEKLAEFLNNERARHFDLMKGPLFRLILIKISDNENVVVFSIHHLVADGWSGQLLMTDLNAIYQNNLQAKRETLKPLMIQYKDFAIWHNNKIVSSNAVSTHTYWRTRLKDFKSLKLPIKHNINLEDSGSTTACKFKFSDEIVAFITSTAKKLEVSVFSILQAVTKLALAHFSGQSDINFLIPSSGRPHADLQNQVGFYLNPVISRTIIDYSKDLKNFIKAIHTNFVESTAYQDYPFDLLLAELFLDKPGSKTTLFSVWVDYHDFSGLANHETTNDSAYLVKPVDFLEVDGGKYALDFLYSKSNGEFGLTLWYKSSLFENQTIQGLIKYLSLIFETAQHTSTSTSIRSLTDNVNYAYEKSSLAENLNYRKDRLKALANFHKSTE